MSFNHAARARILGFLALMSFGMPEAVWANSTSPWVELTQACERVIVEQSFQPLNNYESAPFTAGLPGIRDYSVYDATRNLVAIARLEKSEWVHCLVRERDESRWRWKDLAKDWSNGFEAGFPESEYHWVEWKYHPGRPFPGAVRCRGESPAILIVPNVETDLFFRVAVRTMQRSGMPPCENNEGS